MGLTRLLFQRIRPIAPAGSCQSVGSGRIHGDLGLQSPSERRSSADHMTVDCVE